MKQTIVLIGAGSAMFGLGTVGDIFRSEVLADSHIVLHDINPTTLQQVATVVENEIAARQLPFTVSATTSREEALQNADFCFISIEIGNRFELWEQDWNIATRHGFRQIYGENGGPGGLFHALRIIPPILEICAEIDRICPEAYVFNFSNPMTRICLAVNRRFPDLRFIGLCHEVVSLPNHLPKILDTPLENLQFRAAGLNHFSVLLEASYRDSGADAYPDIRAKAPAYFEQVYSAAEKIKSFLGDPNALETTRPWTGRTLFKEVLERFGYLPITEDSHFGEYIHWAYEVADHAGIEDFYANYKVWSLGHLVPEEQIKGRDKAAGWTAVDIITGILTDSHHEDHAVNMMNEGYIDNLPRDMVVEVPAIITKDGLKGVQIGNLPHGIAGLLTNQVGTISLNAEAALTGSRDLVMQALLLDPVVDSVQSAEALLNTMLNLQERYLGYIK